MEYILQRNAAYGDAAQTVFVRYADAVIVPKIQKKAERRYGAVTHGLSLTAENLKSLVTKIHSITNKPVSFQ